MKRKILIGICWTLAILILAAGGWFLYRWSQFSTYTDTSFRFSVKYPKAWKKVDRYQGTAVAFIRPKQSALETFIANVNITVQEVPNRVATFESFSQKIMEQLNAVYKKSINIIEDKDFVFAGRRGHRVILKSPKPDNLQLMFVWTIKGSMAYIFTFLATEKQYQELLPTIDQMVHSFQLN